MDNLHGLVDNWSAAVDDAPRCLCTGVPELEALIHRPRSDRCNGAILHAESRFTAQILSVTEKSVDKWVNLWMNLYLTLRFSACVETRTEPVLSLEESS